MICQCLADQLFASADLLATDKSRYFAQPRPVIVNYVKVIFLSDILSHSYTHIYLRRFTHKRIQTGGFGLPELGWTPLFLNLLKKKQQHFNFRVSPADA